MFFRLTVLISINIFADKHKNRKNKLILWFSNNFVKNNFKKNKLFLIFLKSLAMQLFTKTKNYKLTNPPGVCGHNLPNKVCIFKHFCSNCLLNLIDLKCI